MIIIVISKLIIYRYKIQILILNKLIIYTRIWKIREQRLKLVFDQIYQLNEKHYSQYYDPKRDKNIQFSYFHSILKENNSQKSIKSPTINKPTSSTITSPRNSFGSLKSNNSRRSTEYSSSPSQSFNSNNQGSVERLNFVNNAIRAPQTITSSAPSPIPSPSLSNNSSSFNPQYFQSEIPKINLNPFTMFGSSGGDVPYSPVASNQINDKIIQNNVTPTVISNITSPQSSIKTQTSSTKKRRKSNPFQQR